MSLVLLMVFTSCEGPETTVTNIVGRNGAVMRKAEMRHTSSIAGITGFRVPVDSTWNLRDSLFISAEGDTTWFILAEKLFDSADAINKAYLADTGKNSSVARTAVFSRKFKWFTTTWYFAEKCEKSLIHGYPLADYLPPDEITFMNLPVKISDDLAAGPDSLGIRSLIDSVAQHTENWMMRSLISEFIAEAGTLCESSDKDSLATEILRSYEDDFYRLVRDDSDFEGMCREVLGDSLFTVLRPELDSAMTITESRLDKSMLFEDYTMQIVMPARIKSTNGYKMRDGALAWPVTGNHFLTDDYVMYAESRDINYWAIILTVILLATAVYMRRSTRRAGRS